MRVAVLDGFSLVFRREAYEQMGGWDDALTAGLTYHCYDTWACCRMAELGLEVWSLPIECWHHAGDAEVHTKAHKVIYERFRSVLPLDVL